MTAQNQFLANGITITSGESATTLLRRIRSIGLRVAARVKNCADHWEAAAMYEQLAALSHTELTKRGLSRANLAQNVHAICERSTDA
jgi:hypothetical protein